MQDMQNVVYIMNSKWNGQTNINTSMFKQLILQKYEKKNMKRKNKKKKTATTTKRNILNHVRQPNCASLIIRKIIFK